MVLTLGVLCISNRGDSACGDPPKGDALIVQETKRFTYPVSTIGTTTNCMYSIENSDLHDVFQSLQLICYRLEKFEH